MINSFLIPRKRANVTILVYHIGVFFSSGMKSIFSGEINFQWCYQIINLLLINCSNSLRFTSFFVPTKSTKGQFGERSIASILFIPILLYSAASFIVNVTFSCIGTVWKLLDIFSPPSCFIFKYLRIYNMIKNRVAFQENILNITRVSMFLKWGASMVYTYCRALSVDSENRKFK